MKTNSVLNKFSSKNIALSQSKGFTLIELLIVIAVLGVLAAGVLTAINPLQQINRGNDAKVKNDVGQLVQAAQAFFAINQFYPANLAALQTSGDIKTIPVGPGGVNYDYAINAACTAAPYTGCEAAINFTLAAPQDPTTPEWCWRSASNLIGESTTVICIP